MKVGVLVVAYNAETTLVDVLDRIPPTASLQLAEVLVQDDHSTDDTHAVASEYLRRESHLNLTIVRHEQNLGYGGNQKSGYRYALDHGWDVVVLLHGDGQYAPEVMGELIAPIVAGDADAVFGSRMMEAGQARRGGMPLYKFVGNRILSTAQNALTGLELSEWHSGYRAYRVSALADVAFGENSDGFDFDTEIILQLAGAGKRIVEVPIPTYYGDEICRVNGIAYAKDVMVDTVRFRLGRSGFGTGQLGRVDDEYAFKPSPNSSHGRILALLQHRAPARILDVGCGAGWLSQALRDCGHTVTGVDVHEADGVSDRTDHFVRADLARGIPDTVGDDFDVVVGADVIEHVPDSSMLLRQIAERVRDDGRVIISVPNFGHWYPRRASSPAASTTTSAASSTRRICGSSAVVPSSAPPSPRASSRWPMPTPACRSTPSEPATAASSRRRSAASTGRSSPSGRRCSPTSSSTSSPASATADRRSTMWRAGTGIPRSERRPAQLVTAVATALFTLVLTRWQPWRLFERAGFSSDFYDGQARAFLHGRLAVSSDLAGIEGFLIDGKTYLYYGPVLSLVRLPTALFGTAFDGRLSRLSMIVGFVVLCTVTFHLARRVARLIGATDGAPWRPTVLVAAVACSPVLALAGQATVYHETELWAFVLVLATFVKAIDVLIEPTRRAALLAGALAVATLLTRVSVGLGAAVAVGIVALVVWRRDRRVSLTMIGLAAAGVVVHVALNVAKFGTLYDLPADRQVLSLLDPNRAAWFAGNNGSFFGLRFVPTTVVHYLRPDAIAFERLVPFARFGPRAHEFGSYPLESNTPSSSLTASATLLVVIAVIGAVLTVRRRVWVVTPFVAAGLVAAAPTIAIGFVANRYLVDLLPGLVVLGAVAVAAFHTTRRTLAVVAVGALTAWGAWVNTSLATWLGDIERPGFTSMRMSVDEAVFGGTPPSVVRLDVDAPVPRDGIVGIDGPCDGLYIASQDTWVALELAAGVRRLDGSLRPDASSVLLADAATQIEVVADRDRGTVQLVLVTADGTQTDGPVLDWDGDDVNVTVISDPTAGGLGRGLQVRLDGQSALSDFRAPDLASLQPGDSFEIDTPTDAGTPICGSLLDRLG